MSEPPDTLSTTFAALADPTRRAILARLTGGELSVTELAKGFQISLPAISRHLKVLEHAGLIARGRDAQWRPCRLEAAPLKEVAAWTARYRQFYEDSFDRLSEYLQAVTPPAAPPAAPLPEPPAQPAAAPPDPPPEPPA